MVQSFERRKMQKAGVYYSFGGYKRISSLWMPFYGLLGFSFCFVIGSIRHENSVSQSGTESISSRGLRCHSWKRHLVLSRLGQPWPSVSTSCPPCTNIAACAELLSRFGFRYAFRSCSTSSSLVARANSKSTQNFQPQIP